MSVPLEPAKKHRNRNENVRENLIFIAIHLNFITYEIYVTIAVSVSLLARNVTIKWPTAASCATPYTAAAPTFGNYCSAKLTIDRVA